jgi:hypothetical protein
MNTCFVSVSVMDDTENTEGMKKIDQNHGFYKPIILEEKHFDVRTISYA